MSHISFPKDDPKFASNLSFMKEEDWMRLHHPKDAPPRTTTSRRPELSFYKGNPILSPSDLLKKDKPRWKPMDKDWKDAISDRYWATNFKGNRGLGAGAADALNSLLPPNITEADARKAILGLRRNLILRDRLLAFAGEEACMPGIEEDILALLAHGEVWLAKGITYKKGEPSRCHENAVRLWEANPTKVALATGYYLCQKGMWRPHSWCIKANERGGRIVETGAAGILYFGACLNEAECEERLSWI